MLIIESNQSTDVIEDGDFVTAYGGTIPAGIANSQPLSDTYQVVLTKAPAAGKEVVVRVVPEETPTSLLVTPIVQLTVDKPTLTFDDSNWNIPQTVRVYARDDTVTDGHDTKVFAPTLHTVNLLQGPLFIQGAGGEGSLTINDPLMLPGETNVKLATGEVQDIDESSITVNVADALTAKGVDVLDDLIERSVEIVKTSTGNGVDAEFIGQFRLISGYQELGSGQVQLFLNIDWDISPADLTTVTEYVITRESANFFAVEEEQTDWLIVDDTDSIADWTGTLQDALVQDYDMTLSGLGMGPDTQIGGRDLPGGITYTQLEYVEINLGKGNNTFDVLATSKRVDYRTWTVLRAGEGNDIVNIDLNADNIVLASGTGASTNESVFTDPDAAFGLDGSLAGKTIRVTAGTGSGQTRVIIDNTATTLTVARPWETSLDATSVYEVLDLADGRFSVDTGDGDDQVYGENSDLSLIMFGGDGGDIIRGGSGEDIIFGDIGRVDYTSEVGELVTRLGDAPSPVNLNSDLDEFIGSERPEGRDGDFIPFIGTVRPYLGQVDSATMTTLTRAAGTDEFPIGDNALTGSRVYINAGTGRGQFRIIASNTTDELTVTEEWNVIPDDTSQYIVFGIGENQTDGVFRDPTVALSIGPSAGGIDDINGNGGNDVIFGGAAGDALLDGGDGKDTIIGDNGRLDFAPATAATEVPPYGSNAPTVRELLQTTHTDTGGADNIVGGVDDDIVFGGFAADSIAGNGGNDTLVGDNGEILYDTTVLDGSPTVREISTTDTTEATGGADTISGNAGDDIILGGVNGSSDVLSGNAGDDILLGDNGELIYDGAADPDLATLDSIVSFLDGRGGSDTVSGNAGSDVIIGGSGGDTLHGDDTTGSSGASDLNDFIFGDNAEIVLTGNIIAELRTSDETESTGGADTITGNADNDVILGGVNNGGVDVISGNDGNDIVLGDNGEVLYNDAADPDLVTLDVIRTSPFTSNGITVLGGGDDISGNAGSDILVGGTGSDLVNGDDAAASADTADLSDLIVGDQVEILLTSNVVDHILTTERTMEAAGDSDTLIGAHGDDILIGGAGGDFVDGGDAIRTKADGADNDDLIFGDHVELNRRQDGTVTDPRFQVLLGQMLYSRYDLPLFLQGPVDIDGDPLFEAYPESGDDAGLVLVDGVARDYRTIDADGNELPLPIWAEWEIVDLDHSQSIVADPGAANRYGDDYIAGGNASDMIFGQLGNDIIQGDGSIETAIDAAATGRDPVSAERNLSVTSDLTPTLSAPAYEMSIVASYDQADDGDDYIEGMGGDDVIFGNLGQDDIIGGSSNLFSLKNDSDPEADRNLRPDGSDMIFGGSGTEIDHDELFDNEAGDIDTIIPEKDIHARDADAIAGDNANIYRIVGTGEITPPGEDPIPGTGDTGGFLSFDYDEARINGIGDPLENQLIIIRAIELLDYTPGGPDYDDVSAANDNGGADEIHGESGDDFIYGMVGADVLFGDSEDDDIIGGWGPDWNSGGQGMDGVIGDDGRIYTARYMDLFDTSTQGNKVTSDLDPADPADYAELLNGVFGVDELNKEIATPGNIQQAIIHPTLVLDDGTVTGEDGTNAVGEIFKTVDLTPFNLSPKSLGYDDPLSEPLYANDIIFGGLGNDFLHGSAGDDAISGAEALPMYFDAPINPDDPEVEVASPQRTETNEFRPDDLLGYLPGRIEFYDYDEEIPRAKLVPFLLNFDASGDPHPGETDNDNFDEDQIFGDLGNDWLVGGPDNDQMFGGFGSDLMDADDDKNTDGDGDGIPGDNYGPDPINIDIQDRAYGGAGRDVLIANTGGDRLMDWIGEFNSFIVPFAPFGEFTVTRAVSPHIFDFLYDLSEAVGADPTRAADTGNSEDRNGEPDGELGLPTQKDGQLWKDQTGAPIDPQPGNIPGGKRLTLRGVDFNDGTQQAFTADAGIWQVVQGRFQVSPEVLGNDATAVFHVGEYIPNYYEVQATISTAKPTGGYKANSYLLFDYVGPTDFKFAGINISTDKLEIGHVDADGWHMDVQTPSKLKPNIDYQVFLAVNGLTATLVVDNRDVLTHVYAARVDDDGYSYGLNYGLVGLGAQNATARIDNVVVQVLKPEVTYEYTTDFSIDASGFTTVQGDWNLADGRYYTGSSSAGSDALSAFDLNVGPNSSLEFSATFGSETFGGFYFDYYGEHDYKFAGVLADSDEIVIGHWNAKRDEMVYDVVAQIGFNIDSDYDLQIALKGPQVSVAIGVEDARGDVFYHDILAHLFNAVVVDGEFGLLSMGGSASFDSFHVQTDDDAFLADNLIASAAPEAVIAESALTDDDLAPIVDEAIERLTDALGIDDALVASLHEVSFRIVDFSDLTLGRAFEDTILIDTDAAGYGWFVDTTPYDDVEFSWLNEEGEMVADSASDAYGDMDLLTVVMHELGHVLGLEDLDPDTHDLMSETLDAGVRQLADDHNNADSMEVNEAEALASLVVMDTAIDEAETVAPAQAAAAKHGSSWLREFLTNGAGKRYNKFDPKDDIKIVLFDDDEKGN